MKGLLALALTSYLWVQDLRDRYRFQAMNQDLIEAQKKLKKAEVDTISSLVLMQETKDPFILGHSERVARFSVAIAEKLGFNKDVQDLLFRSASLHDLGKIVVPDAILLKPGKLDPKEWEIMKTHTTIGAEILSGNDSKLLEMARIIALTHHEKWDGSGYPIGLKGEEIPLIGRIVCICDVFDALQSKRPYKEAWPVDKAIEEVKRLNNIFFDPKVYKTFNKILHKILLLNNPK